MSGRRRTAEPHAAASGQVDPRLDPPEPFNPSQVLQSTDPTEVTGFQQVATEDHHLVGDPISAPPAEEQVELSPEEQVTFASLLTCGRRSKTITVLDHTVVVETLCGDDDLRIALYVKDYQGTLGETRAYQIGVAAAGIRTIDGFPLVQSLYEKATNDALFDQKVKKVSEMYPTVINRIYRAVMDAEKEFVELAVKLGKLDG